MTDTPKADKFYSWETGMPTKPDVDVLLRHWPELKVGDVIPYAEIGVLIGVDWRSHRFKSVTSVWRNRLEETGVILECKTGQAFFVASADQVTANTYDVIAHAGRKYRRHRKKLAAVPTETEQQREVISHQGRLMKMMEEDARKKRMNILPNTVAEAMPKRIPPAVAPHQSTEETTWKSA